MKDLYLKKYGNVIEISHPIWAERFYFLGYQA